MQLAKIPLSMNGSNNSIAGPAWSAGCRSSTPIKRWALPPKLWV